MKDGESVVTATNAAEFDELLSPFEVDLEMIFRDMQEKAFAILKKGVKDNSSIEDMLDAIDGLTDQKIE